MNVITRDTTTRDTGDLQARLRAHIGRHAEKQFDWDAFPSNRGFAELERAQMRYVGAGGSPKVGDVSTLKPEHFTVSLIHQPVGKYAAAHAHEIEEAFLVLQGVLTVGWERDGDVVEIGLGPKDMIVNVDGIAHGFRNSGVEPVLLSIMVGSARPLPPSYHAHPKDTGPELARAFGAQPGRTARFDAESEHPLQQHMARHVVRYAERRPHWDAAGIAHMVYVGEGAVAPVGNRKELLTIPRGCGVRGYNRDVEETFLVIGGCLSVGWEDGGRMAEVRLGPKDLVLSPAGMTHWFRNDGVEDAQVFMVVGSGKVDGVAFVPA